MLTPPALKKGDAIAIVAPARSIAKEEIAPAMKMIADWGFQVVAGKNLFNKYHQFSGKDRERADDLQQMLDDKDIKAILCARGGYGTVRTLERLNFEKFINNPKWIIGFSDITVLHAYINEKLGIKTLHAQMAVNFPNTGKENQSLKLLKETLFGKPLACSWETNYEAPKEKEISGQLTGGNLSVLYSLTGTPFDISTDGKILFLEDLDEYLYHVDRMMMNFKLSKKLDRIKALMVGGMTEMNDNEIPFGKTAYEIIREVAENFNFPLFLDCPSGHIDNNFPLIMGGTVNIQKKGQTINMEFTP
ncbi:MAG: LD-carboxypeptidase [Bacteroidales bacterium]|nr:LD-carboxypeptidase [Bacteroidales bacterium]